MWLRALATSREIPAGERLLDFPGEVEFLLVGLVFLLELVGEIGGLALGLDEFGDIAGNAEGALDVAVAVAPGELGGHDPGFVALAPGFMFELVR